MKNRKKALQTQRTSGLIATTPRTTLNGLHTPPTVVEPVPGPSFLSSPPLPWNEQFSESRSLEKAIRKNLPGLGFRTEAVE